MDPSRLEFPHLGVFCIDSYQVLSVQTFPESHSGRFRLLSRRLFTGDIVWSTVSAEYHLFHTLGLVQAGSAWWGEGAGDWEW